MGRVDNLKSTLIVLLKESNPHRIPLLRIDLVELDRPRHVLRRHLLFLRQRLNRRLGDAVAIHLAIPAQVAPRIKAPEPIRVQHRLPHRRHIDPPPCTAVAPWPCRNSPCRLSALVCRGRLQREVTHQPTLVRARQWIAGHHERDVLWRCAAQLPEEEPVVVIVVPAVGLQRAAQLLGDMLLGFRADLRACGEAGLQQDEALVRHAIGVAEELLGPADHRRLRAPLFMGRRYAVQRLGRRRDLQRFQRGVRRRDGPATRQRAARQQQRHRGEADAQGTSPSAGCIVVTPPPDSPSPHRSCTA